MDTHFSGLSSSAVMHKHQQQNKAHKATGEPPAIITSRPSVAGNLPHGMEHRFHAAPLSECEFLRLPVVGRKCGFTGLSRSGLAAVSKAAKAFISVRLPGKVRGAVLIDKNKLADFLRSNAEGGKEGCE
jgi:hypothetical protein